MILVFWSNPIEQKADFADWIVTIESRNMAQKL